MTSSKKHPDHHYIPQGYLKGFLNNDELFVVNRKYGTIRPTSTAGVAYKPGFYIVDTIDEKNSSEVEENFSKIETVCIPIIKKMAAEEYLTNSNLADLAIYIALQYGRTPFYRARMDHVGTIVMTNLMKEQLAKAYNDPEKYSKLMSRLQASNSKIEIPSREKIKEWILKPGPLANIKLDNGTYVKQFLENANTVADELLKKKWIVLRAPRNATFITSDNPIGLYLHRSLDSGEALAILLKDVQRYFPINAKTCLVIVDDDHFGLKKSGLSKDQVKDINRLIYSQAQQYVISGSKPLLLSLKAYNEKH